jgi:hypothetical protein
MTEEKRTEIAIPTERMVSDLISVDLAKETAVAEELLAQANRAEITDADSYASGGDLIHISATNEKRVEANRKSLADPFFKVKKFIDGQFKKVKDEYGEVRKAVEPKMLQWKREEDKRLRDLARIEAKRIEDEALAKAELEKEEDHQDEVMEEAAKATEKMVEKAAVGQTYGNYGSSTGTAVKYSTEITNWMDFLVGLVKHVAAGNKRNINLDDLITFNKGAMNKLAKDMRAAGVKKMPGAKFLEEESLRVR